MNAWYIMTNELEKTFFDTFGIEPKCVKRTLKLVMPEYNENDLPKDLRQFISSQARVYRVYPQITDRILLELICLNNIYLWETHTSTVNELKNVLLNKYIEHVNLMADENEKQEYINQVRALFEEGK